MATKFGYVERNIENDVNWGEVGKGFADMLVAEREERQAKKDLLDDAMIKTQDALKEAPLGYNTDFNDRIIGLADNASSYLLAANKDLKAGRITPAEYMRKVQRMNSSADQIFNLSNNYNKLYEEHLNRLDSGVSGEVEQQIFEDISNMTNFNENDFFIDSTGAIVAAPLVTDKNGVTTIDPSRARSAQAMFNLAQNFIDKVDINKTTANAVAFLGDYIDTESAAASRKVGGKTVTVSDITKRDDYEQSRAAQIDIILSSDNDIASVLADSMKSKGYKVVTDVNKLSKDSAEREKQVYIDLSNGKEGMAQLTDGQKEAARDHVGNLIDSMIDKKYGETTTPVVEASWAEKQFWWTQSQNKDKENTVMNQLALLYAGQTPEDVKASIQYFKGLNPNIQNIERENNQIVITYRDNKGVTRRTAPLDLTFDFITFAKSATALTGIADSDRAIKSLDLSGNIQTDFEGNIVKAEFSDNIGGVDTPMVISLPDTDVTPQKIDFKKAYGKFLDDNINVNKSGTEIQNKLQGMGIQSEFDAATNQIKIVESKDKATGATSGPTFIIGEAMSINALDSYLRGNATQQTRFKNKLGTMGGSMSSY
jgi:hypothetical protein